jgi:hypothetical protein
MGRAVMATPVAIAKVAGAADSEVKPIQTAQSKADLQRQRREFFERVEQDFATEPVDAVWSPRETEAIKQALRVVPSIHGTIDSVESRSALSRIEATFDGAPQYNELLRALFMPVVDPTDPGATRPPLLAGSFT